MCIIYPAYQRNENDILPLLKDMGGYFEFDNETEILVKGAKTDREDLIFDEKTLPFEFKGNPVIANLYEVSYHVPFSLIAALIIWTVYYTVNSIGGKSSAF